MEDETTNDEDITIDYQNEKVYMCIPLSLFSSGYVLADDILKMKICHQHENTFFSKLKKMSNTMCNAFKHSCS